MSRLVELSPDDPRWQAFAAAAPGATVFHHPAWLEVIREAYRYPALALAQLDSQGAVEAGTPVLRVPRLRGQAWVSLPFTDHCPPLARDGSALDRFAVGAAGWRAERRASLEVRDALPAGSGWHPETIGVRHLLALDGGLAAVERLVPSPVLRHIRGAERSGLRARVTRAPADLPAFYRLHERTRRRLGVPVQPKRFIAALWRRIVQPGLGWAVMAETGAGRPVATGLFLAARGTVIMKYSASEPASWPLKPNHLVLWTAVAWACERGCSTLDLGRSELHHAGLRRYKASWGAEEVPLAYSTRQPASGCGQSRVRDALAPVISRSPVVVCRALGELLYPFAG